MTNNENNSNKVYYILGFRYILRYEWNDFILNIAVTLNFFKYSN